MYFTTGSYSLISNSIRTLTEIRIYSCREFWELGGGRVGCAGLLLSGESEIVVSVENLRGDLNWELGKCKATSPSEMAPRTTGPKGRSRWLGTDDQLEQVEEMLVCLPMKMKEQEDFYIVS